MLKLREAMPRSMRWAVCLLAAMAGLFATAVSVGTGTSTHALGHSRATKHVGKARANTTAATGNETRTYSGGRMMAADPSGGYWLVNWVGVVTSYGGAPTFGSPALSGLKLAEPIVGMAATPDGQGYWLVARDGGVLTYGEAGFKGSSGAIRLNQPIIGMAATPDGQGYWLVASDGGIFTYGDAKLYGSTGNLHLNQPIIGMAATPDGQGYWLVASDGGVFTFGDARFYGSTGNIHLNRSIAGIVPTPDGAGYWLVGADGGVFTYGDAKFEGSLGSTGKSVVIGVMVDPSTGAYTLVELNGSAAVPSLTATPTPTPTPTAATQAPSEPPASATRPAVPRSSTTTTTPRGTTTTGPSAPSPTTTTPTVVASGNDAVPDAPDSLGAPTDLVFDDNFDTGSLNTSVWAPEWFSDGSTSNGTVMDSSNVSVGPDGLALQLTANGTGGLVSTNPDDGVAGHSGFQIAPSPGKPVYIEFEATLPGASGKVANWPALWLDGQTWPEDGEIDVMEGLGGYAAYHIHFGTSGEGSEGPGAGVNDAAGTHTYGVLWTTTSITFVYDGTVVGTIAESLTSPEYLVMENSFNSADPTALPATLDVRYVRVWQ